MQILTAEDAEDAEEKRKQRLARNAGNPDCSYIETFRQFSYSLHLNFLCVLKAQHLRPKLPRPLR